MEMTILIEVIDIVSEIESCHLQARRIAEMINSGIQPLQNLGLLRKLEKYTEKSETQALGKYWIERGFKGKKKM